MVARFSVRNQTTLTVVVLIGVLARDLLAQVPVTPIKATVCEIIQHSEQYNGKLVQVRAKYQSSMETSGLVEGECYLHLGNADAAYLSNLAPRDEYAFVPMVPDPANHYQLIWDVAVPKPENWSLDRPTGLQWRRLVPPVPVETKYDDGMRQFDDLARDRRTCRNCPPKDDVEATFTGRFDWSEYPIVAVRSRRTGKVSLLPGGFGHLGAALRQLKLESVRDATTVPLAPADRP